MAQILLSTTGTLSPVTINDLGAVDFVHPTVDELLFDTTLQSNPYTLEELRLSDDLQNAIVNGWIILKDEFGNIIGSVTEAMYDLDDNKVKVSSSDHPTDYLSNQISGSTNKINITISSSGNNQTLLFNIGNDVFDKTNDDANNINITSISGLTANTIQQALEEININTVQSDWNASSGDAFIQNKPTIGSLAGLNTVGTTQIDNNSVTNAKTADMGANTIKVNNTGTSGDPVDLTMGASTFLARLATGNIVAATVAQIKNLIGNFTSTLAGLVPSSGGGTTNFLRADGTWSTPSVVVQRDVQIASNTNSVNTTSSTFIDIPNMTLTTSNTSGMDYNINFSADVTASNKNVYFYFEIMIDGVPITGTNRQIVVGVNNGHISININWVALNLATAKVIKVRYKTDSVNTLTLTNRSLTLFGVK